MKTGLNQSMINVLNTCEFSGNNRVCSLLLNEVSLKPSFSFDFRSGDIEDKTDLGHLDGSKAAAKSVLTFMLYLLYDTASIKPKNTRFLCLKALNSMRMFKSAIYTDRGSFTYI